MSKVIEKDGRKYRWRRGKLVEIPAEWVGKVTSRQTKNKRMPLNRRTRKTKKKIKR